MACSCTYTRSMDLIVIGIGYTPIYEESYHGTLFSHEEMTEELARCVRGIPCCVEHDDKIPIGYVLDSEITSTMQLRVALHIHGNDMVLEALPGALQERYFNSLSLGHDVSFDIRDSYVSVHAKRPSEISIVRAGDRPLTHIEDFAFVPPGVHVQEYYRKHIRPFYFESTNFSTF